MIAYMGAPMWYITLSPADSKHPICLYFADNKEKLDVTLTRPADEQYRLIARNSVASACFFHFMINMFIQHVLGVSTDHCGLYGEMLIWCKIAYAQIGQIFHIISAINQYLQPILTIF